MRAARDLRPHEVPATVADLVALMTGTDPALDRVKVEADTGPGLDLGKAGLLVLGAIGMAAAVAGRAVRALSRAA